MNRSLLLVICDFLLLSLLALVRFESQGNDAQAVPLRSEAEAALELGEPPSPEADLLAAMREALAAEAAERAAVLARTSETEAALRTREAELAAQSEALAAREAELRAAAAVQQALVVQRDQLANQRDDAAAALERLAQQQAALGAEQQALAAAQLREAAERRAAEAALATAQAELAATRAAQSELATNLGASRTEAEVSRQRLAELQQRLQERESALSRAREEAAQLAAEASAQERAQLALLNQLAVLQTEAEGVKQALSVARESAVATAEQRAAMQAQADRLFDRLADLSTAQNQLATELATSRPLSVNEIYRQHLARTVAIEITTVESVLLGDRTRTVSLVGLPATIAGEVGVAFPLDTTPLNSRGLRSVTLTLGTSPQTVSPTWLGRLTEDPRVGWLPLSAEDLAKLGVKPAVASTTPTGASQAILMARDLTNSYGTVPYRLLAEAPQHVALVRSGIERLFGDLSPRRGDALYQPNGEWMGFLVTDNHGVVVSRRPAMGSARLRLNPLADPATISTWGALGNDLRTALPSTIQ